MSNASAIAITGIGLTAPNGNNLAEYRENLINGVCGLKVSDVRYMGNQVAGFCEFDEHKYQKKKTRRRGTRAGSVAIYCANEALQDSSLDLNKVDKSMVGVYLGITEHGNVETENEIFQLHQNELNTTYWSHHHNPRTVANAPAGEVTLNLGITGPHYTIGSACAGGNMGIIKGVQQLLLGEVDIALAGGVSESPHTFGIFAAFAAQGALANDEDPKNAIKPLDPKRKGTVIAEGGCIYILERLEDAQKRGAKIYGTIAGYASNSDATDFVNPNATRQAECMRKAMSRAGITEKDINIVSMHATGTGAGDIAETAGVREVFDESKNTFVNFTKGHIGHTMGAAGALELAGNIPAFDDNIVHPGIGTDEVDADCALNGLVVREPKPAGDVQYILNNSFGMLGINSTVIVKKYNS